MKESLCISVKLCLLYFTGEGKGRGGTGLLGVTGGKSSFVLLPIFKKLPFGVVLPAEWLSVK